MRLTKIKLAGFKSFVDPTAIGFPTNLVGVVGPNGCGKSNIIDAVRWVMGEISAKHLRGESMADVIFNGSGSRKPVGTASVELVFDNSDGKLAGEYAAYTEVSLKRVVSRDGQSTYFLNGVRCRRKDITQLFLGTGLGSRSYAIIEQGMISRLIEAKPDDLRAFLEEAAGISKYRVRQEEAIRKLKRATHRIAEGDFDYDPQIPAGDEIGDLARDFTTMAARLKVLEQMSLDASPLTRHEDPCGEVRLVRDHVPNLEHAADPGDGDLHLADVVRNRHAVGARGLSRGPGQPLRVRACPQRGSLQGDGQGGCHRPGRRRR